jgi:hypothetical protein
MFEQSESLIQIIASHNWRLYQIPIGTAPSWEEIEFRGPAPYFDTGYDFLFAPIPKTGQSLRQAYSLLNGRMPSLLIDPRWEGIDEVFHSPYSAEGSNEIIFTRLWFPNENYAVVISPKSPENPDPSSASIRLTHLVETFEKYFRIIKPLDMGLIISNSNMPPNPEYN